MIARFNPTGTHVHKGFLKVRIDLYPDITSKTYPIHHIQVPVYPDIEAPLNGYPGEKTWVESHEVWDEIDEIFIEVEGHWVPSDWEDYNNWVEGLPKVWQLNPCLCHFIKIDQDTALASLNGIVRAIFNKPTVAQLDDLLSKLDTPQVAKLMRSKVGAGKQLPPQANIPEIIASLNAHFVNLEIEV